eukprot:2828544-Pleurochrysis_carterae.AAC.1
MDESVATAVDICSERTAEQQRKREGQVRGVREGMARARGLRAVQRACALQVARCNSRASSPVESVALSLRRCSALPRWHKARASVMSA